MKNDPGGKKNSQDGKLEVRTIQVTQTARLASASSNEGCLVMVLSGSGMLYWNQVPGNGVGAGPDISMDVRFHSDTPQTQIILFLHYSTPQAGEQEQNPAIPFARRDGPAQAATLRMADLVPMLICVACGNGLFFVQ